jgi:hypothetical protein
VKTLPTEETNTAHLLTLKRYLIQFGGWGYGKKLVKNNVCRKVLKVILNMHNIIKSYVMQNDDISGLFTCDIEKVNKCAV